MDFFTAYPRFKRFVQNFKDDFLELLTTPATPDFLTGAAAIGIAMFLKKQIRDNKLMVLDAATNRRRICYG